MAFLALAIALAVGFVVLLGYPKLILPAVFLVMGVYIYGSARWHAYWAPVAKKVMSQPWTSSTGEAMETVVENAVVQLNAFSQSHTLRVSIYRRDDGRRVQRTMIGDDATFLGVHGIGLWFYIEDRFYARISGLVCVDRETGDFIYHVPRSEIAAVEKGRKRGQIFAEDREGNTTEMQLADEVANRRE
ncbi:MAG: hypothetical protein ACF8CQ_19705 [Rhodopirellula sp. JB044]|uniref:hypothetical protein n=1 Tax=Rhodopirellula sp. JB044 TaxID=3342844 RepID=UPI00370B0BAA